MTERKEADYGSTKRMEGHIKSSLVSIPVKMFNATSSRKSIGFNGKPRP